MLDIKMRGTKNCIIAANVTALLLLAVGLISPLTPSEGTPSLIELIVFAVLPFFILVVIILKTENRLAKIFIGSEIAIVFIVLYKVLGAVYKYAKP
jgi:hypothetical protein